MSGEIDYQTLVRFAPMVFQALGVEERRQAILMEALDRKDALINGQPNIAALLEMKEKLSNLPPAEQTIRVLCKNCRCCNTIKF